MADDRAEILKAEALKDRGYVYPEWELVAHEDPDFMASYNQYYRDALNRDSGLSIKYREMVALGVLCYRGASEGALVNHIKRAMQHGATKAEVIGALEAAAIPGGAPTFLAGIKALVAIEKEKK
jgi:alkylhydroperoxidase/carboxymuconolactone decarboxylase family protein YurZ